MTVLKHTVMDHISHFCVSVTQELITKYSKIYILRTHKLQNRLNKNTNQHCHCTVLQQKQSVQYLAVQHGL